MVTAIFAELSAIVTAFLAVLADMFSGVGGLFYDSVDGLTILGTFSLLAVGTGVVWFGFRFIMGLIKGLTGRK